MLIDGVIKFNKNTFEIHEIHQVCVIDRRRRIIFIQVNCRGATMKRLPDLNFFFVLWWYNSPREVDDAGWIVHIIFVNKGKLDQFHFLRTVVLPIIVRWSPTTSAAATASNPSCCWTFIQVQELLKKLQIAHQKKFNTNTSSHYSPPNSSSPQALLQTTEEPPPLSLSLGSVSVNRCMGRPTQLPLLSHRFCLASAGLCCGEVESTTYMFPELMLAMLPCLVCTKVSNMLLHRRMMMMMLMMMAECGKTNAKVKVKHLRAPSRPGGRENRDSFARINNTATIEQKWVSEWGGLCWL